MTAQEFINWLDGYLDAITDSFPDTYPAVGRIKSKLLEVDRGFNFETMPTAPYPTPGTTPYNPDHWWENGYRVTCSGVANTDDSQKKQKPEILKD